MNNVLVLTQGFDAWKAQNRTISRRQPMITPSLYIPTINHKRLASKLTTLIASQNPKQIIIDTRPAEAYSGQTSSASRYGHIPSAINIPFEQNIDYSSTELRLKSIEQLATIYADIPKTTSIILYCSMGRASSSTYLSLRELGYNVANYDGSWQEWANDASFSIANPSRSKQGEF